MRSNAIAKENYSICLGYFVNADGEYSKSLGYGVNSSNNYEFGTGYFNLTRKENSTFGSSLNTLSTIGNGYDGAKTVRHNAFEIRQVW